MVCGCVGVSWRSRTLSTWSGGVGGWKRRYPWTIHRCISEFVFVCVSTAAVIGKPDPCVVRGTISQKKT